MARLQTLVRRVAGRGGTTLLLGTMKKSILGCEINVLLRNLAPALFGPTDDEATLHLQARDTAPGSKAGISSTSRTELHFRDSPRHILAIN